MYRACFLEESQDSFKFGRLDVIWFKIAHDLANQSLTAAVPSLAAELGFKNVPDQTQLRSY
jgi:hypothetical protein